MNLKHFPPMSGQIAMLLSFWQNGEFVQCILHRPVGRKAVGLLSPQQYNQRRLQDSKVSPKAGTAKIYRDKSTFKPTSKNHLMWATENSPKIKCEACGPAGKEIQ